MQPFGASLLPAHGPKAPAADPLPSARLAALQIARKATQSERSGATPCPCRLPQRWSFMWATCHQGVKTRNNAS